MAGIFFSASLVENALMLAEELDNEEDVSPLQPHHVHYLATPYDTYGAGRALMNAMKVAESQET